MRQLAAVALSLALISACNDHDPQAATATAGATGEAGASSGSDALGVEFEEIAVEGEPTFITDFAFYPGESDDLLALSKDGTLRRYHLDGTRASLLGVSSVAGVFAEGDCGAISLAFELDVGRAPFLYVGACVSFTGSQILRLDLDHDGNVVPGSEVAILYVGHAQATRPWHNIGSIGFEPNGVLWALFGDKVQKGAARDLSTNLGKLVRIVPSREPAQGGYQPAADNPELPGSANPDVYALGLRSPFRGTRDRRGFYWIGDVGGDLFEEIDLVTGPGMDFGWSDFEGPCDDCSFTSSPLLYWPQTADAAYVLDDARRQDTSARVAWAGPEVLEHEPDRYRGQLAGSVLFGDYCSGFVRHARVDDVGTVILDSPLGHLSNAAAFHQHRDGFVYAATFGRCEVAKDNADDQPFSRLFRMIARD